MQSAPVCTATSPRASTTPICRTRASGSAERSSASAPSAPAPASRRSSAPGPYAGSATDWLATAPTPALAHETMAPTENQCEWTATPRSPDAASRATMEYVPMRKVENHRTTPGDVLARVRAIPAGFVRAYGDICPGAPRYAGSVLHDTDEPGLPWWRVVRADGALANGAR